MAGKGRTLPPGETRSCGEGTVTGCLDLTVAGSPTGTQGLKGETEGEKADLGGAWRGNSA